MNLYSIYHRIIKNQFETKNMTSTTASTINEDTLNIAKDLIKKFEGFSLHAYKDIAGIETIGWGHRIMPTENLKEITTQQAEDLLTHDMQRAIMAVHENVHVHLTNEQTAAVISFVYNIGVEAFKDSTFLKLLNENDLREAANEMLKWSHINHHEAAGLLKRREVESVLLCGF